MHGPGAGVNVGVVGPDRLIFPDIFPADGAGPMVGRAEEQAAEFAVQSTQP
jgi:hypothetical protein